MWTTRGVFLLVRHSAPRCGGALSSAEEEPFGLLTHCSSSSLGKNSAPGGPAEGWLLMSTRRRERRLSVGAGRNSRLDAAVVTGTAGRRRFSSSLLFFLLLLPFLLFLLYFATYHRPKHEKATDGGLVPPVYDRGLVKTEITYREVLSVSREMCSATSSSGFSVECFRLV